MPNTPDYGSYLNMDDYSSQNSQPTGSVGFSYTQQNPSMLGYSPPAQPSSSSYWNMPTAYQPSQSYQPQSQYTPSYQNVQTTPPPPTPPPQQSSVDTSGSGGSVDMISSIIGMGFEAGAMYNEAYINKHMQEEFKKMRKEDLARWQKVYNDQMEQQNKNNIYRDKTFRESVGQSRSALRWDKQRWGQEFDWGKERWGKEFALTSEQWNFNKKLTEDQIKKSNIDRTTNQMVGIVNRDAEMKKHLLELRSY